MDALATLLEPLKAILATLMAVGVPGCLLLFVIGLQQRWWVLGSFYKDAERREAEWKSAALSSQSQAERLADHALARRSRER